MEVAGCQNMLHDNLRCSSEQWNFHVRCLAEAQEIGTEKGFLKRTEQLHHHIFKVPLVPLSKGRFSAIFSRKSFSFGDCSGSETRCDPDVSPSETALLIISLTPFDTL
jgi:hypothetical protein